MSYRTNTHDQKMGQNDPATRIPLFPAQLIYFTLLMNFAAAPLVRAAVQRSITRGNLMLVDPA